MSGYIFKDCAHRRRRACRLVSPICFQARELGRALHCCLLKETQCVQAPRRLSSEWLILSLKGDGPESMVHLAALLRLSLTMDGGFPRLAFGFLAMGLNGKRTFLLEIKFGK